MNSNEFAPMYDLERLSENERAAYYRNACELLGVPANLNLLAFINMVVGDSGRHLVLYAKKGATDLIRQNRGISTVALDAIKDLVPGQICFVAVGRDKEGREERAIGSAAIDGLRGKDLSDAVMIAQTRATRRMTLQFVGGGILDESELPSNQTSLTNSNPALDAIITQPVVVPNSTPSIVEPPRPAIAPEIIEAGNTLVAAMIRDTQKAVDAALAEPTLAQKEAQAALATVKPDALAAASGEKTFKTVAELAATLPANNPLAQVAATEPQKQRRRKSANEVTLNTPAQFAQPLPAPIVAQVTAAVTELAPIINKAIAQAAAETLPAQAVQPVVAKDPLTPEQKKEITERLARYRNEILPGKVENGYGGMDNVEGLGGVEIQLRKFVAKFNPAKPSSKTWDYEDWKKFVGFFDDTVKAIGARGLVRYIQQGIGLVPFPDDNSAPRAR